MPTYRVDLRRATTHPLKWDWSQTVVADNAQLAIQAVYIDWAKAALGLIWLPPLADCHSVTTEIDSPTVAHPHSPDAENLVIL